MALTIRLTKEETEKLDSVSQELSKKTASKAIKAMIHNYMRMHTELADTKTALVEKSSELVKIKSLIIESQEMEQKRLSIDNELIRMV